MRVNYTLTGENITIFHAGKIFNIPSTFVRYEELKEHLKQKEHDLDFIESIVNVREKVERLSQGNVKVCGDQVYFKGMRIRTRLAERLVELIDEGFEVTPWINFMENVMQNPSVDARERLFVFLEKNNSPLTEDGHFIAFKRVNKDFTDIYTGKMDNSPGQIVEMPREKVDANNRITCSRGLHIAASIYLDSYAHASDSRTIVCKVNPADVVAVPPDYNETKMRACRYEVISEVEVGDVADIESTNIYTDPKVEDEMYVVTGYDVVTDYDPYTSDYYSEGFDDEFSEEYKVLTVEEIVNSFGYNYLPIYTDTNESRVYLVMNVKEFANGLNSDVDSLSEELDDVHGLTLWIKVVDGHGNTVYVDISNNYVHYESGVKHVPSIFSFWTLVDDEEYLVEYLYDNGTFKKDEPISTTTVKQELTFERNGVTFLASEIIEGIKETGSLNEWARTEGVPRSTVQGWVKKIINQ